jgi:hypothetical protein
MKLLDRVSYHARRRGQVVWRNQHLAALQQPGRFRQLNRFLPPDVHFAWDVIERHPRRTPAQHACRQYVLGRTGHHFDEKCCYVVLRLLSS